MFLLLLLFLLLRLLLLLLLPMLANASYILISSIFHVAVGEIQKLAVCYLNLPRSSLGNARKKINARIRMLPVASEALGYCVLASGSMNENHEKTPRSAW